MIPITSARDCELPASDTGATPDRSLFATRVRRPPWNVVGGVVSDRRTNDGRRGRRRRSRGGTRTCVSHSRIRAAGEASPTHRRRRCCPAACCPHSHPPGPPWCVRRPLRPSAADVDPRNSDPVANDATANVASADRANGIRAPRWPSQLRAAPKRRLWRA